MYKKAFILSACCFIAAIVSAQSTTDTPIPANLADVIQKVAATGFNDFKLLRGERTDNESNEEYQSNVLLDGSDNCYIQINSFGSNLTEWVAMYTLTTKEKDEASAIYSEWFDKVKTITVILEGHKYQWKMDGSALLDKIDEDGGIFKTLNLTTVNNKKLVLSLSLIAPPPPETGFDKWGLTLSVHQKK